MHTSASEHPNAHGRQGALTLGALARKASSLERFGKADVAPCRPPRATASRKWRWIATLAQQSARARHRYGPARAGSVAPLAPQSCLKASTPRRDPKRAPLAGRCAPSWRSAPATRCGWPPPPPPPGPAGCRAWACPPCHRAAPAPAGPPGNQRKEQTKVMVRPAGWAAHPSSPGPSHQRKRRAGLGTCSARRVRRESFAPGHRVRAHPPWRATWAWAPDLPHCCGWLPVPLTNGAPTHPP